MRIILQTAIALGAAITLCVAPADAQGRHQGAKKERTERRESSGRSGASKSDRKKDATHSNNHSSDRSFRPGRGGSNNGSNYRQPANSNQNQRPSQNNQRPPQQGHRPPQAHRPVAVAPPMRPGRPPMRPYSRPVPPPAWRPAPHGPSFASILGLAFGTAVGMSLDYLTGNGYLVDGYSQDVVYLRNVTQMNLNWPDATLFYGPNGLAGSEFIYSTPGRDPYRYNLLYRRLMNLYGPPASSFRTAGGIGVTWFGPSSTYIQLEFKPMVANSGVTRFYTTLQFGN